MVKNDQIVLIEYLGTDAEYIYRRAYLDFAMAVIRGTQNTIKLQTLTILVHVMGLLFPAFLLAVGFAGGLPTAIFKPLTCLHRRNKGPPLRIL